MLPHFNLERPTTLAEALQVVDAEHVPYCGGVELLLAMRSGERSPRTLVDLKRLPELAGIRIEGDELVIGATESHMDIAANDLVRQRLPILARIERELGNARVRTQGSLGGNMCFAEPKSDLPGVMMALDASLTLASMTGVRVVKVEGFITGSRQVERAPEELVLDIRIPIRADEVSAYEHYKTMERRPTVGVGMVREATGQVRVAVGAIGDVPRVWRFASVGAVDPDLIAAEVEPTVDLNGSARYKRHITAVYTRRVLAALERQDS